MSQRIRILLVDDHQRLRQVISNLLELEDDMVVVGQASNGVEALERARALQPEVVIMDYELPEMGGVRAIQDLRMQVPQVAVIGFSAHESGYVKQLMLNAGAAAYISKNGETDELLGAIRQHSCPMV
jgi:DNA-binding NarL/FixJ family response regulator